MYSCRSLFLGGTYSTLCISGKASVSSTRCRHRPLGRSIMSSPNSGVDSSFMSRTMFLCFQSSTCASLCSVEMALFLITFSATECSKRSREGINIIKDSPLPTLTTIDSLEDSAVGASAQNVTPVKPGFGWSLLEQLIALWRGQDQRILLIHILQQRPIVKETTIRII